MDGSLLTTLIPMIAVFVLFYFIFIRPQQNQQRERNQMLANLKKGDKVITIGGLHGVITDLTDERVTLKVSENTKVVFERSAINANLTAQEAQEEKK